MYIILGFMRLILKELRPRAAERTLKWKNGKNALATAMTDGASALCRQ